MMQHALPLCLLHLRAPRCACLSCNRFQMQLVMWVFITAMYICTQKQYAYPLYAPIPSCTCTYTQCACYVRAHYSELYLYAEIERLSALYAYSNLCLYAETVRFLCEGSLQRLISVRINSTLVMWGFIIASYICTQKESCVVLLCLVLAVSFSLEYICLS